MMTSLSGYRLCLKNRTRCCCLSLAATSMLHSSCCSTVKTPFLCAAAIAPSQSRRGLSAASAAPASLSPASPSSVSAVRASFCPTSRSCSHLQAFASSIQQSRPGRPSAAQGRTSDVQNPACAWHHGAGDLHIRPVSPLSQPSSTRCTASTRRVRCTASMGRGGADDEPAVPPEDPHERGASGLSAGGEYGSDGMAPEKLNQAFTEAVDIYKQASAISSLQVKAEMEQAFASEVPGDTAAASAQHELAPQALLSFWVEQGLSHAAAERLLEEISSSGRSYTMNQLSSKVQRWQRVLPDANISALAAKDPHILDADISTALINMIALVEAFPGREVTALLTQQPKLMWTEDLRPRVARVFEHLVQLHPSKDNAVIAEIIFDNPELLFRMDYYKNATLIDELPIEIQNMMILADQGIGYLYRYYNNKKTNYQAELSSNSNYNMTEF